jgi:hypothetical protein
MLIVAAMLSIASWQLLVDWCFVAKKIDLGCAMLTDVELIL